MEFSKEMLEKAKAAGSVDELIKAAKEEGIELTAEQANNAFTHLNKIGEIADEELENVSGGEECSYESDPNFQKYKIGQRVYYNAILDNQRGIRLYAIIEDIDPYRSSTFEINKEWVYHLVDENDGYRHTEYESSIYSA